MEPQWLGQDRTLLHEVRTALAHTHHVAVTEPWWGEEPAE